MLPEEIHLLLADDDSDDCLFFKEALDEISIPTTLTAVHDGEALMSYLTQHPTPFPTVLYLDLNLPKKSGRECLQEIKNNEQLKNLHVVIYSTSYDAKIADGLYELGADYYLRKPSGFQLLKEVILKSLTLISQLKNSKPSKTEYIINCNY
jgi:CheY-like chemotaxis protein